MKNNEKIAALFYEIADMLDIKRDNIWVPRAYRRAARSLENIRTDVNVTYKKGGVKELDKIEGIGEGLARKIEEFLKTGKIKEYQKLKKITPKGTSDLLSVEGLGPKRVEQFKKLGIKNLKDLEKAIKKGKLEKLPGFKDKLIKNIKEEVGVAKTSKGRLPLSEVLPQAKKVITYLSRYGLKVSIAGSVRRRKGTIRDLDVLVSSTNSKKVVDKFVSMPNKVKILAKGSTRASIRLDSGLQVDLRVVKPDSWGSALQYFTGSKDHNIKIRKIAMRKGYKLSEYGLFDRKTDKKIAGRSEKDIYTKLGLKYPRPQDRER